MHIGTKIKQLREEKRFSQSEMAELLGMSQSAYSRIERDETPVLMDDVIRFAKALNIPIIDFLPDTIKNHFINDHGQGGPNLVMGDFHYHQNGDMESQKLLIQLLQKVLDKMGE